MKRLLFIAALAGAALWVGVAPATARPLSDDDESSEVSKRKKRDGGGEEGEEDFRAKLPPVSSPRSSL